MRNRLIVMLGALMSIALLAGCAPAATPSRAASSETARAPSGPAESTRLDLGPLYYQTSGGYLLTGYPDDKVPLYSSDRISSAGYWVHTQSSPNALVPNGGLRNVYTVNYFSSDDESTILQYYRGLMDRVVEDEPNLLSGTVGEYGLRVGIIPNRGVDTSVLGVDDHDGPEVVLLVHVMEGASDTNPYMTDFPTAFVETDAGSALQDDFIVSTLTGTIQYRKMYETQRTQEEHAAYYQEQYGETEGFSPDEFGLISWNDQGGTVMVQWVPTEIPSVVLVVSRPLK